MWRSVSLATMIHLGHHDDLWCHFVFLLQGRPLFRSCLLNMTFVFLLSHKFTYPLHTFWTPSDLQPSWSTALLIYSPVDLQPCRSTALLIYRVSHIELDIMNWLWQKYASRILFESSFGIMRLKIFDIPTWFSKK